MIKRIWNQEKFKYEILNIISKVCKKCKQEKLFEEFSIVKTKKDGRNIICKICDNKSKKYMYDNFEIIRNRINETSKISWRKACKNLTDRYIIECLKDRGFSKEYISKDLIELERQLIKGKREITKQLKNES